MASQHGDPEEWKTLRAEWYGRNERWLKLRGAMEALFVTSAVKSIDPKRLDEVQELLDQREFGLAFGLLTAILASNNVKLSDDAYAILQNIGERMKLREDDWHGLKRS